MLRLAMYLRISMEDEDMGMQGKDEEAAEKDSKLEQAMGIKEYQDLDVYDNKIMAKLFDRVDVYGEDRIEVRWKFQDIFDVLEHNMN